MTTRTIAVEMIRGAYRGAFGAEPDQAGLDFWTDVAIRDRWDVYRLAEEFAKVAAKELKPEPEKVEVLDGVGAIFRWSIWTHRPSGSLYSVSALGERIALELDEVGAFDPGPRIELSPDQLLTLMSPVDPVDGSRWLDIHGANEGRDGVAQGRERGNMVVFLYDGDDKPVRIHASAFGHRFREV